MASGLSVTSLVLSKWKYKPIILSTRTKFILLTHAYLLLMDQRLPTFIVLSIVFYLYNSTQNLSKGLRISMQTYQAAKAHKSACGHVVLHHH